MQNCFEIVAFCKCIYRNCNCTFTVVVGTLVYVSKLTNTKELQTRERETVLRKKYYRNNRFLINNN